MVRKTLRLARLLAAALLAFAAAAAIWLLWLPDPSPLKRHPPKTTAYIELRKAQAREQRSGEGDQIGAHLASSQDKSSPSS